MAEKTGKTKRHPAWQRRTMPADVRALGHAGQFIAHAIRNSDAKRRGRVAT